MSWRDEYQRKTVTVEEMAKHVKSGNFIMLGLALGSPSPRILHAILDRALGHGINFVDTANMYGGTAGPGITEEIIGRWFARGEGRRERTVLATKLYNSMKGFGRTDNWPNTTRLSALHIRQADDAS